MSMRLIPATISKIFEGKKKRFIIPVYQRAYSWEKAQLTMFLDDLLDQNSDGNPYNFGNILVEKTSEADVFEIIDGQQRLTTIVIFLRALMNVLSEKNLDDINDEMNPNEIFEDFIKVKRNVKFNTVSYDNEFFDFVIVNNEDGCQPNTISQKRIIEAKRFFKKRLDKLDLNKLSHLYFVLTHSEVNWLQTEGKTESALLFELQNNRGVSLTTLEKLKSFFMYQAYQKSSIDETNHIVDKLAEHFNSIYNTASKIYRFNEEELFTICSYFISKEFRTLTMEKIMLDTKKSPNCIDYILNFSARLSKAFDYILQIEKLQNNYKLEKIQEFRFYEAYPFFMIAIENNTNEKTFDELINVLEKIMFRVRLINTRADFRSRLQIILKTYKSDNVKKLVTDFDTEFYYYWGESDIKRQLRNMQGNRLFHYIVMEYENSLSSIGYDVSRTEVLKKEQEHIAPQNPRPYDSKGYDLEKGRYSDTFYEMGMNAIGNLTVLPKTENQFLTNKNFYDKLAVFDESVLVQHKEIRDLASSKDDELMWDIDAVNRRTEKISNFILNHWSLENYREDILEKH